MIRPAQHDLPRRVLTVVRWPVGGIRTYLLYNYPILAAAGFRFTLVGPADEPFRVLCREMQSWEGAEFVEAPVDGPRCRLRSTVRRVLRQRRFDLIHSQGLTAGIEGVLANLGCGVPHVVTSHDVFRPDQFAGLVGRLKRRLLGQVLRRAHALVAVSHDAHQNHLRYLPSLGRGPCRVLTILNGIDTTRPGNHTRAQGPRLRERLGVAEDVCLLGYLGRFMEQKGFLVLVNALERLLDAGPTPRVRLVAVGSGDYLREYRQEIERRPRVAGCITLLDHTPDVKPILREIDLLVMPSRWEACPLLPMEAMCEGTPVLGSDCIGLREVLSGSPSKMVPSGDAAALAEGIRQAIDAPWKEKAAAYAPVARQRFDVRLSARELLALFERVLRPAAVTNGFRV